MKRTLQTHSDCSPSNRAPKQNEFSLTFLDDADLIQRLRGELQFVLAAAKRAWPAFKHEPVKVSVRLLGDLLRTIQSSLTRPHALRALLTAIVIVCLSMLGLLSLDRARPIAGRPFSLDDVSDVNMIDFSNNDLGIGADGQGRVGFNSRKGEGSNPAPARARGGGGSGNHDPLPAQVGKIPQPSQIQAPIPSTPKLNPALPVAGIDLDPMLWRDLPERNFGDPRSKSNATSNGSGDGGAIGTGKGLGVGEGAGPGFGPGRKGNIGDGDKEIGGGGTGQGSGYGCSSGCAGDDRIFTTNQVNERARVLSKPEPQYTEEARKKDVTGTVVLRVVFSSSGLVTNIRAMQSLPEGLTEKAIAAAREIHFLPAKRDGRPVSVYVQLEYNFNLY